MPSKLSHLMLLKNLLIPAHMKSKEAVARVYVLSFFLMNSIKLFAGFTVKCRCTDEEPIFYIRRLFISERDTKKSHWDY